MAPATHRVLSVGLAVGRIRRDRWAALALGIHRALSVGWVVGRIPRALSAGLALGIPRALLAGLADAMALGCCASTRGPM